MMVLILKCAFHTVKVKEKVKSSKEKQMAVGEGRSLACNHQPPAGVKRSCALNLTLQIPSAFLCDEFIRLNCPAPHMGYLNVSTLIKN